MRRLLLLAAVAVVPAAVAAQDFAFRRDLAAGSRLHVSNIIGDVRIAPASGRTVEVTAVKRAGRHGDPEDVEIRTVELQGGVAICVIYPAQRSKWQNPRRQRDEEASPCERESWNQGTIRNDTEVDFTLKVPPGLRLHAGTVSGDVYAESLSGDLDIRSVSGHVRLDGGEGPRIKLATVSGDVELLRIRARDVLGQTISGEVTFEGPIQDGGTYDFVTTSGDINVVLPDRPNATFSAATFSGRFSSAFPTTSDETRRRRHRHSAVWGNGSARLDVESLSGDIAIRTGRP
ncbi:MAG: DUF4097 family beta strand repeat-containing protein [Gemmatimonadales bacterium]